MTTLHQNTTVFCQPVYLWEGRKNVFSPAPTVSSKHLHMQLSLTARARLISENNATAG